MSDTLLIVAGGFLCALAISIIALIVQVVRKRPCKKLGIVCVGLLCGFIVFEGIGIALKDDLKSGSDSTLKEENEEEKDLNEVEEENAIIVVDSDADTSMIEVTVEEDTVDGKKRGVIIFTKNNSDEIFTGDVYVSFYDKSSRDNLGNTMVIVEELLPGRENWTRDTIDADYSALDIIVDFSEVSFTPIAGVNSEISEDLTTKVKNSYRLNFEGVSWYEDITEIKVYEDGTCIAKVKDNTKNEKQFYALTLWNCSNDKGIECVRVVDQNEKLLAVAP